MQNGLDDAALAHPGVTGEQHPVLAVGEERPENRLHIRAPPGQRPPSPDVMGADRRRQIGHGGIGRP
ncbi:hypothetical protein GCM10010208_73010 [Actinomadura livida]|nr:hypothetical protein GCM10010208_73010 [Actinomadura livida]